jgi:hypothetical protein
VKELFEKSSWLSKYRISKLTLNFVEFPIYQLNFSIKNHLLRCNRPNLIIQKLKSISGRCHSRSKIQNTFYCVGSKVLFIQKLNTIHNMVPKHPEGCAILAYIINNVFDLYDNNSLALALENKGCKDIYDAISMSDNDIDSLTYTNANMTIINLQGALKNMIRILKRYIMYRYCSGEPIGNDWESITAEKFDNYRTGTYLLENFGQPNLAMQASLSCVMFLGDISYDLKPQVSQQEVSDSITLADAPNNYIEFATSDNHPQLESTHLNSNQYSNIETLESDSACLEMGSINIENVHKEDKANISQGIDLEKSTLCTLCDDEKIGFIQNSKKGELIDVCVTKANKVLGNDKTLMPNLNGKMILLTVKEHDIIKVHGMTGVNKLVNDVVVIETMIEAMVEPQLVIDRGRITSLHADGE